MPDLAFYLDAAASAFTPGSILSIGAGVLIGYLVGVVPGLNRSVAIATAWAYMSYA